MLKQVIIFVSGLAVGVAGGVLASKRHYAVLTKESINSIKETYERKLEDATTPHVFNNEQETKKAEMELAKPKMTDTGTEMEKKLAKKYSDEIISYSKYANVEFDDDESEEKEEDDVKPAIYEISAEELAHDRPEFEKIDVTWYPDPASDAGGLLVEDMSDKPVNVDDAIARIGLDSKLSGSEYYIRNEDIRADFIVTIESHPYA